MHRAPGFRLPEIALNEIDLSGLVAVRQVLRRYGAQDHSRWVFRGTLAAVDGPVFVKLWNPGYVRAQTLPEALAAGFYDAANVPALRALVVSGGLCRGYVMAACGHRLRMGRGFFDLICRRTAETGYVAVQFSPAHTMRLGRHLSMIDLEGVYPLHRLDLVGAHHSAFAYTPYATFVAELAGAPLPPLEPQMPLYDRARRFATARLRPSAPITKDRQDLIAR